MNWTIVFFTAAFWLHQNIYFGWNRQPQSHAELLADGIVYLLAALAVMK
ncbi:hypothetical protein IB024_01595 [Brucella sp. 6810]|nr:hypothetical protein [Brucella sp. 6810]QNQ62478.1 hypothetical protein IB024_01595 [Brucella sp. 6810]